MKLLTKDMWIGTLVLMASVSTVLTALTKPSECGSSIGCYSDCFGDECKFVVTWRSNGDKVDFTLSLDFFVVSSDRYIALGLSDDNSMDDDSVTDCIMNGMTTTEVKKSYNTKVDGNRANLLLDEQPQSGLSNISALSADGILTCAYSQTKEPSHNNVKSLKTNWKLFVVTGRTTRGIKNKHLIPDISPEKVNFTETEDITGPAPNVVIAVHGLLMVFAWIGFASCGIFTARFYKKSGLPERQLCSKARWFAVHRVCMVMTVLCCIAGFVIIFIDVGAWAKLDGHTNWQKAHPYLGTIVTGLAVLNPILALIRPHPNAHNHHLFNWAHWLIGWGAHALSALTIMLGVTLDKARQPPWVFWFVVAWLSYNVCVILMMELYHFITNDKGDKHVQMYIIGKMVRKDHKIKLVVFALHWFINQGFVQLIGMLVIMYPLNLLKYADTDQQPPL